VIPSETVNRLGPSYFDRYLPGYADGGFVTNQATQGVEGQMAIISLIRSLPVPVLSIKEMTEVQGQIEFKNAISTR
jgi:hypothetical protein